jgi:uncharacterized membrane protein YfbV (UPF0208 family)
MDKRDRVSFITLWLELLLDDWKSRRWRSFIPTSVILCSSIGACVAWYFPISPAPNFKSNLITIYAGVITAQGIILALSLSSLQHIYENISRKDFAMFLRENGVIEYYLFFIQYIQAVGVIALVMVVATAFALLFNLPSHYVRILIAITLGAFLYSTKQAIDTSILVRDLIWYRSLFEEREDQNGQESKTIRMDERR